MWTLDSTRIFTQTFDSDDKQIVARLTPFSGGTIHQTFGYENGIFRVGGYVVSHADKNTLRAMAKDGAVHTLSGPDSLTISGIVNSVSAKELPFVRQTFYLDGSHLEADPVFMVDIELYE